VNSPGMADATAPSAEKQRPAMDEGGSPALPPILHVMPAEPFGGLQLLVIELAERQRARGRQVDIVLLNPSARVEKRCRAAGIVPIILDGPKPLRVLRLMQVLRARPAALLHSHCEPIWAVLPLAARARRWMVHLHVYARDQTLRDRLGNRFRRLFARRFIAISRSVGQSFVDRGLVAAARLDVVHNGLNFPPFRPLSPEGDVETPQLVGFVGRAVREKGLFDFIDVADLLRDEPGLRFVIAGEGADLEEARAEIAARALQDKIAVLGFVQDTEALWGELDLLLMLSSREPFGLVILEAIASGTAVLGYDVSSGGSEIMAVIPGCRMVQPFSSSVLADAVRDMLKDRAGLRRDLAAGRQVLADRFSMDRMEEGVAREYRRMLTE